MVENIPSGGQPSNTQMPSGQAADIAARLTSEATEQSGRATAEAMRQGAEATSEAMRRTGEGAGETVRRSTQGVAESQHEFAQQMAERFQETSRKLAEAAHGNTETLRGLMTLPISAKGGLHDLQQSVTGLVENVVQTNLRMAQELFQLANPSAVIELQQRFARAYIDALMQGTASLVHAVRRTADETLQPLEQQVAKRRQDQRFAHAGE